MFPRNWHNSKKSSAQQQSVHFNEAPCYLLWPEFLFHWYKLVSEHSSWCKAFINMCKLYVVFPSWPLADKILPPDRWDAKTCPLTFTSKVWACSFLIFLQTDRRSVVAGNNSCRFQEVSRRRSMLNEHRQRRWLATDAATNVYFLIYRMVTILDTDVRWSQ